MKIPEDDVGVELMNAKFRDMGVLVATDMGYRVAPEFLDRVESAVRRRIGDDVSAEDPRFKEAVVEELEGMGIPDGFEPILANWVVHELRLRLWSDG